MISSDDCFRQRLLGIFAEEASEHLAEIDTCLLSLEQAASLGGVTAMATILKHLHTLKGAARSVDLGDLEGLCHALEGVFAAATSAVVKFNPEQFDRLHYVFGVANLLVTNPSVRTRNQAVVAVGELNSLTNTIAKSAPVRPSAAPAHAFESVPKREPVAVGPIFNKSDRVRVRGKSLDAIRCQAEALVPLELRLKHHVTAIFALVDTMAERRRHSGATAHETQDTTCFERECMQIAAELRGTGGDLATVRERLMDATLETALVPFSAAIDGLPALVRNLARRHNKRVHMSVSGESVAIDRRLLEVLRESLIHLVTNAVDHAIESPSKRKAAEKPQEGQIRIAITQHDSRNVAVRVSDDGAGIDVASVIQAAAMSCGLGIEDLEPQLNERQRMHLALRAGVSTMSEVSPVSGRGMGLAIVAEKVSAVGGELLIENVPGRGCTFELILPVGVASLRALLVEAAGLRYIVPLAGLESVRALDADDIHTVQGHETVLVGTEVVPLIRLGRLFSAGSSKLMARGGVALIARIGNQAFGVLVDVLHAEQEVLPKGLGPLLQRVRYISGVAQLGDGSLVPVVGLVDMATSALPNADVSLTGTTNGTVEHNPDRRVLVVEDSITSRLLLKHILEGAGCRVDTAVDGLDALSKLRNEQYDIVVSDIEMPNMDGLALTKSIRANPKTAELPVILVTSLQSPEERERGLLAGADSYFTKGAFDQDRLLATVRRMA